MSENALHQAYQVFQCLIQSALADLIDCVDIVNLFASYAFMRDNLKFIKSMKFPHNAIVRTKVRKNKWWRTRVDNDIIKSLCKFPLTDLYIRAHYNGSRYDNCYFNNSGLKSLADANLPLKTLHFEKCNMIDDDGLCYLKNLELIVLSLNFCRKVTDCGLKYLNFSKLTKLNITHCNITDDGIQHIASAQHLTHLDLGTLCVPLSMIHLYKFTNVTDTSLMYLKNLPLKYLKFHCCHCVTDNGLNHLINLPLKVMHVILCGYNRVTHEGLAKLKNVKKTYKIYSKNFITHITDNNLVIYASDDGEYIK